MDRLYDPNCIIPLVNKLNEGNLTIEEVLDDNDAINDLKLNTESKLQDM